MGTSKGPMETSWELRDGTSWELSWELHGNPWELCEKLRGNLRGPMGTCGNLWNLWEL